MTRTNPQILSLEIDNMNCGACAARIDAALQNVPGVEAPAVNLATQSVRVQVPDPDIARATFAALDAAGYAPRNHPVRLTIGGLNCASCVARVEKALSDVPGVTSARVNLATGTAQVESQTRGSATLISAVEAVGKTASLHVSAHTNDNAATGDTAGDETRDLRRNLLLAALLTLPVFMLEMGSHLYPPLHHAIAATLGHTNSWLLQFVLTALVLAIPGRQILTRGVRGLIRRTPDMNALVTLGVSAAFGFSTLALFAPALLPETSRAVYFESAAVIVTLILLGRFLEARAKGQTGAAIRKLMQLAPPTALLERNGKVTEVPVEAVTRGDRLHLRPGGRVAVDGRVVSGSSYVDESMVTGEPVPVAKDKGTDLVGGTVNGTGALVYRATAVGSDTVLAQIIAMVEDAQSARLPVQDLVNRVTLWFVPAVMAVALLTVFGWLVFGPAPALSHALVAGVSVLIIACPCAMGLATPTSIMVGTGRAAGLGVLFRKGDALQALQGVRTVAFDKTGTLTKGAPELVDIATTGDADALLRLAAAAETHSEHPLARALVRAAETRGWTLPAPSAFHSETGKGVRATIEGQEIRIGTVRYLSESGIDTTHLQADLNRCAEQGQTPVLLAVAGKAQAIFAISDPVKPDAVETIAALHEMGLRTVLITGDTAQTARAVARTLGIDDVIAEVLPDGKVAAVQTLDGPVAFVGDGINDAPALSTATVGLALGTGTDVAMEAADVVLMSSELRGVTDAVAISRATLRNIRQNLIWAFGYNVLLIPVAAGGLAIFGGPLLSPPLAAGAMALSSLFVLSNALRLRWVGTRHNSPTLSAETALRDALA